MTGPCPDGERVEQADLDDDRQRPDELESAESTAWWRQDAAERRMATGEEAGEGEDEPGLDEYECRHRFGYLFRNTGAA
jgi:hypothetical protein